MAAKILLLALLAVLSATPQVADGVTASNVTELLEEILEQVEEIIEKVDKDVDDAITSLENNITKRVESALASWEEKIKYLEAELKVAAEIVKICAENQTSLKTVASDLFNETVECAAVQVKAVNAALTEVKVTDMEILEEAAKAAAIVSKCAAKVNPIEVSLCLMEDEPSVIVKIGDLTKELLLRCAVVGEKIVELLPKTDVCFAERLAESVKEVVEIVNGTIYCIEDY